MNDCVFCKIIKGEIPCTKIYEDKNTLAFLDINPITKGHTLVIPKEHATIIEELTDDSLSKTMVVVKKIVTVLDQLNEGCNLGLNNKEAAGQLVPHVHFHIMPRNKGDGLVSWPGGKYKEGEADKVANKIKSLLK